MEDFKKHQQELAQSGYGIPDSFYVDADENRGQESTEEKSGDGGKAASKSEPESEHGYKGKMLTPDELANKSATGPASNKSGTGTITAPSTGPVPYASDAARDASVAADLTYADFTGKTPTGANGFTKADVEAITKAKE